MTRKRISLTDAASLTGKSPAQLREMVEDGALSPRETPSGHLRFSLEDLRGLVEPSILDKFAVKSDLSGGYVRPKRLLTTPTYTRDKRKIMKTYIRDADACMGFVRGFQKVEVSLALHMMIDLMAIHYDEYRGIPSEPSSYIAGQVGISEKMWAQTVQPTLMRAGRIRKVTRNGIKVWVFPDDMMTGEKALFRPLAQFLGDVKMSPGNAMSHESIDDPSLLVDDEAGSGEWGPKPMGWEECNNQPVDEPPTMINEAMDAAPAAPPRVKSGEAEERHVPDTIMGAPNPEAFRDNPVVDDPNLTIHPPIDHGKRMMEETISEMKRIGSRRDAVDGSGDDPEPVAPPEPEVVEDNTPVPDIPSHSAHAVLERAGIDVTGHRLGELYWHRVEHNEILAEWLKVMSINEIVDRLNRARLAGKLPKNPNGLTAFEDIVLGE